MRERRGERDGVRGREMKMESEEQKEMECKGWDREKRRNGE